MTAIECSEKMRAVGPVPDPVPGLPYEVSCPALGHHEWESITAESEAHAALRFARIHGVRGSWSFRDSPGGVLVRVRGPRLLASYRVSYEEEPVYIARLEDAEVAP